MVGGIDRIVASSMHRGGSYTIQVMEDVNEYERDGRPRPEVFLTIREGEFTEDDPIIDVLLSAGEARRVALALLARADEADQEPWLTKKELEEV